MRAQCERSRLNGRPRLRQPKRRHTRNRSGSSNAFSISVGVCQLDPTPFQSPDLLPFPVRPDTELEEPEPELKLEPLSLKASLTKTVRCELSGENALHFADLLPSSLIQKTPLNDMSALRRTLSISKKTLESCVCLTSLSLSLILDNALNFMPTTF
jgi:hypothetical protein